MARYKDSLLRLCPWLVNFGYVLFIISTYSFYLDRHLVFQPNPLAESRLDILGFGFIFTWIMLLILFVVSLFIAGTHKRRMVEKYLLVTIFLVLSALDLGLNSILENQIP